MSYERVYMATTGNKYLTEILEHLNEYHDRHGQILSIKNIKEGILHVMEQEKEKSNVTAITLHPILHLSLPLI